MVVQHDRLYLEPGNSPTMTRTPRTVSKQAPWSAPQASAGPLTSDDQRPRPVQGDYTTRNRMPSVEGESILHISFPTCEI